MRRLERGLEGLGGNGKGREGRGVEECRVMLGEVLGRCGLEKVGTMC